MRRRRLFTGMVAGIASLAGCSGKLPDGVQKSPTRGENSLDGITESPTPTGNPLKYDTYEQSFTNTGAYTDAEKYQNEMLTATFTAPSGTTFTVNGFWDGGDTFRVRFAPNERGTWRWETSSPVDETSLSGHTGSFRAREPTAADKNANRKYKGPPTVGASDIYTVHADDGDPFLWIADTAFDLDGFPLADYKTFIDDRANNKDYSVVMNATVMGNANNTPSNKVGDYFTSTWDLVNPPALQRMDEKVKYANDNGIITWWQPIWIGDAEENTTVNERDWWWRHCIARFQGYNVVWVIYGDHGDTSVCEHDRMGNQVEAFNGRPAQIVTSHAGPTGDNNTTTLHLSGKSYMDIHSHQTHGTKPEFDLLEEDTNNHTGPFVNAEPGIVGFGGEDRLEIRRDFYQVMMSGIGGGCAFGIKEYSTSWDGITTIDDPLCHDIRRIKELMESFEWWNLVNDQTLITAGESTGETRKVATKLQDGSRMFVYYPDSTSTADIDLSPISTSKTEVEWYNPTDATRTTDMESPHSSAAVLSFEPPWTDPADAIMIAKEQ